MGGSAWLVFFWGGVLAVCGLEGVLEVVVRDGGVADGSLFFFPLLSGRIGGQSGLRVGGELNGGRCRCWNVIVPCLVPELCACLCEHLACRQEKDERERRRRRMRRTKMKSVRCWGSDDGYAPAWCTDCKTGLAASGKRACNGWRNGRAPGHAAIVGACDMGPQVCRRHQTSQ